MRTTRTIIGVVLAAAFALPALACNGDETEFEETPPAAEEVEINDELDDRGTQEPQQPRQMPGDTLP